jgi:hypothetical protein
MTQGQGKPLPPSMTCQGAWIVENYLYLYHSDKSQSQAGSSPRFTVGVPRIDGGFAFGLDAAQIGAVLGTDAATIIAANEGKTLIFLCVAAIAPAHGGKSARRYVFQLGERKGALAIEVTDQEGTA